MWMNLADLARAGDPGQAPMEKVAMELTYRGLDGPGEFLFTAFWGDSFQGAKSDFVRSLGLPEERVYSVSFPSALGLDYAAIELDGRTAKALYIDLDKNGALSDDERLAPIMQGGPAPLKLGDTTQQFITPDLELCEEGQRKAPYRMRLLCSWTGDTLNFACCPACVWEGTTRLQGTAARLTLFDFNLNGSFQDFGEDGYILEVDGTVQENHHIRSSRPLSPMVAFQSRFYELSFLGREGEEGFGGVFESMELSETKLELEVASAEEIQPELKEARFRSIHDKSAIFRLDDLESAIPTGAYKLDHGYLYYGVEEIWKASLRKESEILVMPDEACRMKLGNPGLKVLVYDLLAKRESGDEDCTVFPEGAYLRISREITGESGEIYRRFYKKYLFHYLKIEPQVRILNAEGDDVASGRLRYG
jgi:hypothetical protein